MEASISVRDPASRIGSRSIRSSLLLMLVILAACAWDVTVALLCDIATAEGLKGAEAGPAFEWPSRAWQLFQGSLMTLAPGVVAAWLTAGGHLDNLRTYIRTVGAFALGSTVGLWLFLPQLTSLFPSDGPAWRLLADFLLTNTMMAAGVLGAIYWWRRETILREELHRTRMGLLALKTDCAEAERLRLRTQIEPHFLFNTMATIVEMYKTDRTGAGRTLARLVDYMSVARVHMQRQEVFLGEELALIDGYLQIQQLRMGARLQYEIEVSPSLRGNRIPPAALLTLVENAIKHGLSPQPGGGLLRVAAHQEGSWVTLNVRDSGVGLRRTSGRGLGLANLRARILGLYGGEASLHLSGVAGVGVVATMRLPLGAPRAAAAA